MGVWKKFGLKKNFSSTPPSNLNYDWSLSTEGGLQGTLLKRGLKLKLDIPGFPFSSVNQETLETRLAFSLFCVNAVYNLWQIRKFVHPLPPTSSPGKDGKMACFGVCAASPLIWQGGGGNGGWRFHFILPTIVFQFFNVLPIKLFCYL